ncbi:DEAD/DEAH box helicase [Oceanobacillus sp. J11TS1]|uniref:DEAD/DEAH box helicase n=1 Tax=Oceanobacillus sp. J11TS1 TaxID=2807191 RepID=UPI001AFE33A4|nr:DEAD/DEAH box helicase [Oceanobacillus sp. J11TS1]GIO24411.1 helicase SNF2 [Oceanobacillus sp. J11TS1]
MKQIKDINIKNAFPDSFYRRGLNYFKNNKVHNLMYDYNQLLWSATVQGTENYTVKINTKDLQQGSIDMYCDCPAFETFGYCKHAVATLLAIQSYEKNGVRPQINHYRLNRFMEAIRGTRSVTDNTSYQQPVMVEYILSWSYMKHLQLEMKIGEKHRYVVKNIKEFLEDYFGKRDYYFSKKFTFQADKHVVDKADQVIFELLYQVSKSAELYDEYNYPGKKSGDRYLLIPPILAKNLLYKLLERNFHVKTDRGEEYEDVQIIDGELPFQFEVMKSDQHISLSLQQGNAMTFFQNYELLFLDGVFYFPTREQIPVLNELEMFRLENIYFDVPIEQTDTFLSEVMPALETVGEIQLDERIEDEVIKEPLKARCYLELKEDMIVGRLEYHYGSHVIDPFQGRKDLDVMLIRDVDKERLIMQHIEEANFRYNGKELYMTVDEEDLYYFLYKILPSLDKAVELFLSSEFKRLFFDYDPQPSTNVRMESQNNLLEIGFSIEGVDDNEINRVLQAVIEKKRYFRLDSGQMLNLDTDEFSSIQNFFDGLGMDKDAVQDGQLHVPVYRGAQLDELLDTKKQYDSHFRELLSHLKSPEEQVYELPDTLQASLRTYQKVGYQWFKSLSQYQLGGILADDMGLGKTLQSIAYITSESEADPVGPHLIVVPSSVVYNWKNELEKFAPHLTSAILTGQPAERHAYMEKSMDKDVWITSYATLRQDIEYYQDITFQTLLLDEAQYIKNYQTKTSKAIRTIRATRRFALSGTPIENSIDELWSIFQVVLPGLMPDQKTFKQLDSKKVSSITKPFILRRLKRDVLKELPDKIESVHISELTSEQKDLYVGYLRKLQQEAAVSMQEDAFQQNRMKILAGLTRLRQICCHPSTFVENYEGQSGKLEQLMETVESAINNGKRLLIFSQFTSMLEIIRDRLEAANYGYFYLHGETPSKNRVEMSERFNNGENDIFLISLKAGGTGLNLTGADTVILYDLWWNPAVEDQATGRAHRFGQKNVVQVIRLVTEGTIEEKIYELQQKKRELIDQVIQPGETMLSSLSEADIKELLNLS